MAELGKGLAARMKELERRFPIVTQRLSAIAEGATLRAIERATELTPPNTFEDGELRGVNMISGEMAEHWASDSQTAPSAAAEGFITVLANDKEYASYVNDGHRLDRHFVPGLYIDPATGLLSRNLDGKGGLVVGTETTYVEGLHITDQAIDTYGEAAREELERLMREVQG